MFEEQIKIIKNAAQSAGNYPGVYKMIDEFKAVIYVGKAKNLHNRLLSYTRIQNMPNRTKMMISKIKNIEFIITASEKEALILESNLIKQMRPYFNVLMRDDKTYPYIFIDESSNFPRITSKRTTSITVKNLFGPYPVAGAMHETIKTIQKIFMLRTCTDNYFNNVKRPCLQYFIKRCSGPCANKISPTEYAKNVALAKKLLAGDDTLAINILQNEMHQAAEKYDFERAAMLRDRIIAINQVQSKQYAEIKQWASMDVIVILNSVINVTFFRSGRNVGSENFVIKNAAEENILEQFLIQFYQYTVKPGILVVNEKLSKNIKSILAIKVIDKVNGQYQKLVELGLQNAQAKLKNEHDYTNELSKLSALVGLKSVNRIEIYDNSHISGKNACAAMAVFQDGNIRPELHRVFKISDEIAAGGDDIAMMKFALTRRFCSKSISEKPDLIIVDGGKLQLGIASSIVGLNTKIIGIAKQNNRSIGDEKIVFPNDSEVFLNDHQDLKNFLIILRDEAHKTAINFHRKTRNKNMKKSLLDIIPGIGNVRKKRLLAHFGSVSAIRNATIEDIVHVQGFNYKYASLVYEFLNKR